AVNAGESQPGHLRQAQSNPRGVSLARGGRVAADGEWLRRRPLAPPPSLLLERRRPEAGEQPEMSVASTARSSALACALGLAVCAYFLAFPLQPNQSDEGLILYN